MSTSALAVAAQDIEALPALIDRAAQALAGARSSAEVLEAREAATFAYDMAKRSARLAKAKSAHDSLVGAAHRAQGEALMIESRAKMRLADEYDDAQERGHIRTRADNQHIPDQNKLSVADVGLTSKQIYEGRRIRDVERAQPGAIREKLQQIVESGGEPNRSLLQRLIATVIRTGRAEKHQADIIKIRQQAVEVPTGLFDVIVIDPPWQMEKIERDVRPNQVAFDYPTMTEEELAAFDVESLAAENCHLFCWATNKHLPTAFRLAEAWGFRSCLTMVWFKAGGFQPVGLPQFNCEFVIYARRGAPRFEDTKQFPVCFQGHRREHSRKPDEFYDMIRRVTGGTRIDMFSREKRDGFEQFGNEVSKFAEAAQ